MKEITLKARKDELPALTQFIDGELEQLGCPFKAQMQLDMAMDELFSNIALYAYPSSEGSATIRFEYDPDQKTVSITLIDQGLPYDPLKKPDPDVTLNAEERTIGGLGIFLVKKTMDDMSYRYENGQNVLTIRKTIF